ncbi:MAG TPA: hypothetical protein VHE57_07855, partial [Mycobacteriales bacterium]|nr:hypothetical protein [Mycobacteriales bacterium]
MSRWELVDHAAILVALTLWAIPLTRAAGGRGVHNELIYSIVLIAVLLALRAWRTGATAVLLAAATSLAALLVCVFAPTHWYGSDVADGYALAAAAFLAVRRYVRDEDRRKLVAAAVCLACLYQFAQAFQPWWGGRDSSVEMSGTFYWHNPYAAFLLPGAVVGLGLILESRRPWSTVGWVSVPLC